MSNYRKATNLPKIIQQTIRHLVSGNSGMPNCIRFGEKAVVTTKLDGTQVNIRIKFQSLSDEEPLIEISGHSSKKPVFSGTLADLEAGTIKGTHQVAITYQKVPLYPIIGPEIPKFIALMREMKLDESNFYCEMILPGRSPLNLNYRDDLRSKIYLFNHLFPVHGEWYRNEVNSRTLRMYHKHEIRTVPLCQEFDKFTTKDFDYLMNCLHNPVIEGFVFSQEECLIKLKTHHYDAGIPTEELKIDSDDQYQQDLKYCYDAFLKAIVSADDYNETNQTLKTIKSELWKEWLHSDHSDFSSKFAELPKAEKAEALKNSDFMKKVLKSLENESGQGTSFTSRNQSVIVSQGLRFMDMNWSINF